MHPHRYRTMRALRLISIKIWRECLHHVHYVLAEHHVDTHLPHNAPCYSLEAPEPLPKQPHSSRSMLHLFCDSAAGLPPLRSHESRRGVRLKIVHGNSKASRHLHRVRVRVQVQVHQSRRVVDAQPRYSKDMARNTNSNRIIEIELSTQGVEALESKSRTQMARYI